MMRRKERRGGSKRVGEVGNGGSQRRKTRGESKNIKKDPPFTTFF